MATVNVGVRLNLENSSLRSLQEDLRRTVQSVRPTLDVGINESGLKQFLKNFNVPLRITGLEGQAEIKRALDSVLENRIVKVAGFDRRDLTRLRSQLQRELNQIKLDAPALDEARREARRLSNQSTAGVGAGGTSSSDVQRATQQVQRLEQDISARRTAVVGLLEDIVDLTGRQKAFEAKTTEEARLASEAQNRIRSQLASIAPGVAALQAEYTKIQPLVEQQATAQANVTRQLLGLQATIARREASEQIINSEVDALVSAEQGLPRETRNLVEARRQRVRVEQEALALAQNFIASSDLPTQAQLDEAITAAKRRAEQNQGQIVISSRQIAQASTERARVEQELLARAKGLLSISDLPSTTQNQPTIDDPRVEQARIDARLTQERARIQKEALTREQEENRKLFDAVRLQADAAGRRAVEENRGLAADRTLEEAKARIKREQVQAQQRVLEAEFSRLRAIQASGPQGGGLNEATQQQDKSIRERITRELASRIVAEAQNTQEALEELRLRNQGNSLLQRQIRDLAGGAQKELNNEIRGQIREVDVALKAFKQQGVFAKAAADKTKDLDQVLTQRVQDAIAFSGFGRSEGLKGVIQGARDAVNKFRDGILGSDISGSTRGLSRAIKTNEAVLRRLNQRREDEIGNLAALRGEQGELLSGLEQLNNAAVITAQLIRTRGAAGVNELASLDRAFDSIKKTEGELASVTRRITGSRRRIANAEQRIASAKERQAQNAQRQASQRGPTVRGQGGGGRNITFRGAGDIQRFGNQLDGSQFTRFIKILTGVEQAATSAGRGISRFTLDVTGGTPTVDRLRSSLSAANQEAFNFGVRASLAARRLLEWAAPAQLIFLTISRLREAVGTLIDLDTQARRLVFFSGQSSPLEGASRAAQTFSERLGGARNNLSAFLLLSRQTGIEVGKIAEAFVTTSRVGTDVTRVINSINAGNTELTRGLAQTTLQLVRLEAGAISAEQAVRRLRAIQAQFIDTLGLTGPAAEEAVANIGSLLATQAAQSSFNVSELSNAVARLGTSFSSIKGANVPATISIIGLAAKKTGAEVGRLATTFRQLTTLTVQNSNALKDAFDIDIIDADTGRQSFEGILDFLREVSRLQGVSATRAGDLASLGTDRRNINEVKQLAAAIDDLEKRFGNLNKEQAQLDIAASAAVDAFRAEQDLANSLESSFNRLTNEFSILANTFTSSDLFSILVDGASSAIQTFTSLIEGVSKLKPILNGVIGFAAAVALPKLAAAFAGVVTSFADAFTGTGAKKEIASLFGSTKTAIDGINRASKEGLITDQQKVALNKQLAAELQRQALINREIQRVKVAIENEEVASVRNEAKLLTLKRQQLELERRLAEEIKRGNRERARGSGIVQRSSKTIFSKGAGAILAGAAISIGGLIASNIGSVIEKSGKGGELAKGVEGGISGAITGGVIGATIGSAIPLIGTAIGGLTGAALGASLGAFTSSGKEAERIAKQAKLLEEESKVRQKAISAQQNIINAQKAQELRFAKERTEEEKRVVGLIDQVKQAQLSVQGANGDINKQAIALTQLNRLQVRLIKAKGDLKRQELEIDARQLAFASALAQFRREEVEEIARINLLREASLSGADQTQKIGLEIEFNRQKTLAQVRAIRREIDAELQRQETIEVKSDNKALEQSRQRILALQSKERLLQFATVQKEIGLRRQAQDRQAAIFEKSISQLKQANDAFAASLGQAFSSQLKVADFILRAGDIASKTLSSNGSAFLAELESQGAGVTVRLRALQRQTQRELSQLQANQRAGRAALEGTGVNAFQSAEDINRAIEQTAQALRAAGARSAEQVFNRVTAEFQGDIFVARERARLSRLEFTQRIAQTRAELQARERLVSAETQLLAQRIKAERELRDIRVDQQREFGRLLLQGPEEFNKAIQEINTATGFFQGIQDLDTGSLQRIADRAVQLRARGRFDILSSVQRGLQTLISTGGARVIGAATNQELARVLEQVSTSGLQGGTSPEEVSLQLQRQREEAERQTDEQRALRARQEELQRIAIRQANIQEAEARIIAEEAIIAAKQRDLLLVSGNRRLVELQRVVNILRSFTQGAANLAGGQLQTGNARTPTPANVNQATGGQQLTPTQLLDGIRRGVIEGEQRREVNRRRDRIVEARQQQQAQQGGGRVDAGRARDGNVRREIERLSRGIIRLSTVIREADELGGIGREPFPPQGPLQGPGGGRGLPPGLNPNAPTGDNLPGIRQNDGLNRVLNDFIGSIRLTQRGFQLVPRELQLLRQTIQDSQEGNATPRQQRRIRELERQQRNFGTRFAGDRAAQGLLADRTGRAGVEGGFRELLQGNTDFIRQLRDLTQTARGSRVGSRGAQELNLRQFQDLLQDAGLGGLAGDVQNNREAARLTNQLLRLSQSLRSNQGPLSRDQIRQLGELLGREFQKAFDSSAQQAGLRRRPGENQNDFERRREEARAQPTTDFERVAENAIKGLNKGVFKEAVVETAKEFKAALTEANLNTAKLLKEAIEGVGDLNVKFQDKVNVNVEAKVEETLKASPELLGAFKNLVPGISEKDADAIVKSLSALIKVERRRGTQLPPGMIDGERNE